MILIFLKIYITLKIDSFSNNQSELESNRLIRSAYLIRIVVRRHPSREHPGAVETRANIRRVGQRNFYVLFFFLVLKYVRR